MNKRGISAVVATVLIILITVVAVTIVWSAIIPMIRDNLDFSSLEGRVLVVTSGGYTFYDSSSGLASVQVKRDMDDGVMNRIKIIFSFDGNSVSSSVVAPDPGNTKVYVFDLSGYGEPERVSVAPIFAVGEKEKVGAVTSDVKVGNGVISGIISRAEWYDLDKEYHSDLSKLSEGLVAYYDFEGDAVDGSGNGNDGTVNGGVGFVEDPERGEVASFDGSTGYIDTKNSFVPVFQDSFTISVLVKPVDGRPPSPMSILGYSTATQYDHIQLRLFVSGGINAIYTTAVGAQTTTDVFLQDGQETWHNLVYVADSTINGPGGLKIYIDGEIESTIGGDTSSDTFSDFDLSEFLVIGAYNRGNVFSEYFSGLIDDVRIYNRELSAEEIRLIALDA